MYHSKTVVAFVTSFTPAFLVSNLLFTHFVVSPQPPDGTKRRSVEGRGELGGSELARRNEAVLDLDLRYNARRASVRDLYLHARVPEAASYDAISVTVVLDNRNAVPRSVGEVDASLDCRIGWEGGRRQISHDSAWGHGLSLARNRVQRAERASEPATPQFLHSQLSEIVEPIEAEKRAFRFGIGVVDETPISSDSTKKGTAVVPATPLQVR